MSALHTVLIVCATLCPARDRLTPADMAFLSQAVYGRPQPPEPLHVLSGGLFRFPGHPRPLRLPTGSVIEPDGHILLPAGTVVERVLTNHALQVKDGYQIEPNRLGIEPDLEAERSGLFVTSVLYDAAKED